MIHSLVRGFWKPSATKRERERVKSLLRDAFFLAVAYYTLIYVVVVTPFTLFREFVVEPVLKMFSPSPEDEEDRHIDMLIDEGYLYRDF